MHPTNKHKPPTPRSAKFEALAARLLAHADRHEKAARPLTATRLRNKAEALLQRALECRAKEAGPKTRPAPKRTKAAEAQAAKPKPAKPRAARKPKPAKPRAARKPKAGNPDPDPTLTENVAPVDPQTPKT